MIRTIMGIIVFSLIVIAYVVMLIRMEKMALHLVKDSKGKKKIVSISLLILPISPFLIFIYTRDGRTILPTSFLMIIAIRIIGNYVVSD